MQANKLVKMKTSKKRIIAIILGSVGILIILLMLGLSYFFGYQVAQGLLYQNAEVDTHDNSLKQLAEWGYCIDEYEQYKFESDYNGNEFTTIAKDGNVIFGTHFVVNNQRDNNTVILVHGLGGDRVCMEPLVKGYLEQGWNVITFDQRASGKSKNEWVTFGYYEKYDIEALVDYVVGITTEKKIVVHGQSMGAVTVGLYAGLKHARQKVSAIIMDSPFDSMENMFLSVWNESPDSEGIPNNYIIWCGDWYLKWNYKFSFDDVDLVKQSRNNQIKTLVIASMKDGLATPKMNEAVYSAIQSQEKQIWKVNSEHIEGFVDYPNEYMNIVIQFIE